MVLQSIHSAPRVFRTVLFMLSLGLMVILFFGSAVMAEDDTHGGDDFRQTAKEYEAEAKKFKKKGYFDVVAIYTRLAEIKRHAAKLADKGRWNDIDWTEYETLTEKLEKLFKKIKK